MNMLRGILCVFLLGSSVLAASDSGRKEEEHGGYPATYLRLRVLSPDRQDLSTPVASYVNDAGQKVDLIGAVHVAEPEYYARLNWLFEEYDMLLFEMIGGEGMQRWEELRRKIDRSMPLGGLTLEEAREWNRMAAGNKKRKQLDMTLLLNLLGGFYKKASNVLELQTQHEGIDYSPAHFVHADMTAYEFMQAQSRKRESFAGLMIKSAASSLLKGEQGYQPDELGMMMDLITGNTDGLKNELMRVLAHTPADALEDTVILEGRNARCMEVFDQRRGGGASRIGIFYGAAHLPGLHAELLKRGYRLQEVRWIPAWSTGG